MTKIGVTCGSFDYYIHDGHLLFLDKCKNLCDILYVALVADKTIRKTKNREPYFNQIDRSLNLLATGLIDDIIFMDHGDKPSVMMSCCPDIYILGKDQYANDWTRQAVEFLYSKCVAVVSTFEKGIDSTTRLLYEIGYIS